jgi:hypothetical protein
VGKWEFCNSIPEDLHPKSFRSQFSHNTNIWISKGSKHMRKGPPVGVGRRRRRRQRAQPRSAAARHTGPEHSSPAGGHPQNRRRPASRGRRLIHLSRRTPSAPATPDRLLRNLLAATTHHPPPTTLPPPPPPLLRR